MNVILAMVAAFFWGTTYAVTQYTLSGWPPLLLGALRALPAGLLLIAFKPNLPKPKEWPVLIRLGCINIALFFGLLFIMAQTLPSAISGVGMVSLPVFAMFYYWLVHKNTPTKVQLISGATLITLAWLLFDPLHLKLNPVGLVAMLCALGCIVIGSNITKSLGLKMHWWPVLCWQLIIGGSILTVIAIMHALSSPAQYLTALQNISPLNIGGLIWLIVLNTMLAYTLYVWMLSRMTVVEFTFAGISNPIAGILMGLLLVGEKFSSTQYLLMGLIILTSLSGSLLSTYFAKKQANKQTNKTIINNEIKPTATKSI
ncbi:EamA family transporter [Psychromonas sp. B3M02]|uniref:DMT family transporter n=1 Tax=Psychromonas sp. B3M02 TaxID=2267226 RepID=UPI000DEA8161|nr:EamA family transporter [Psychromonas sp. B3M02]RBW48035.1 EamA family transporter [Psychromonas sp. B3M02]